MSEEAARRVEASVERGKQAHELWDRANRKHKASMDARRLLQACAEYARLGTHTWWPDPGEPIEIGYERTGSLSDWRPWNLEFCRRWVESRWLPSLAPVRETIGVAGVRGDLPLRSSEAEITKCHYLRLLEAEDPASVLEEVVDGLARDRLGLGACRFKLGEFFVILAGQVPPHPSPRQLEKAGQLYPWEEPSQRRPLVPLRPQDVTVELWDDRRLRFCTEGRAIRTFTLGRTSTERTLSESLWQKLTGLVLFHAQKRGRTGAGVDPSAEVRWVMGVDEGKWDTCRRAIPRLNEYLVRRLNLTSDPLRCETLGRVVVCTFGGFSERASPASWSGERSAGMGDEEPAVGNATLPEESLERR